jgi:hypothetical protein
VDGRVRLTQGRAPESYMNQVSMRPIRWTLDEFFTVLFNYIFPVNYISVLRKRFARIRQGDQSIREFGFRIDELAALIGDITPEQLAVTY